MTGEQSNAALAVPLVEIQHDDDAKLARRPRERVGRRSGNRLGEPPGVGAGRALRMEPLERELRERDHFRALARPPASTAARPAAHVVGPCPLSRAAAPVQFSRG